MSKRKKDMFKELNESLRKLDRSLKSYEDYLKKIKKKNPRNPTPFEEETAPLIFDIGKTIGEVGENVKGIRSSIDFQTIVTTIVFGGLTVVMAIGFATI